jgi:hypothetical protein
MNGDFDEIGGGIDFVVVNGSLFAKCYPNSTIPGVLISSLFFYFVSQPSSNVCTSSYMWKFSIASDCNRHKPIRQKKNIYVSSSTCHRSYI